MSLLFTNIKTLYGIQSAETTVLKGRELGEVAQINNAWLSIHNGLISGFGEMDTMATQVVESSFTEVISVNDQLILPTWCDSHTHIVFAGSREDEFVSRIKGVSYETIAKNGGGILNSAKKLNDTSEDDLFKSASARLHSLIKMGTGAIEIKSGYGLSLAGEIKMLRVIKRLKESFEIPIKSTFLGAHAFPAEFKNNQQAYIDLIINEMLPAIQKEDLADYIDVFCENGFFNSEQTAEILSAGKKHGLKAKIHANQLNYSGGIQVGVANNAISVDHLECVGDAEIDALKNSNTIGTILPSAAFFLGISYQPARKMIDEGIAIALASDFNPGSSPSGNMSFVFALACTQLKMTPEEAFNAITHNGAHAMEIGNEIGSITVGKKANIIITKKIPSLAFIPYSFGSNLIDQVFINGKKYE
jgi:imidazolonepropionase